MAEDHIFISYSRSDGEFAQKVAEDLRANGVNIWLDKLDIPVGARWDRTVEEALETCGRLLLIMSPNSVASENVMDEISEAFQNNKPIIPILAKSCEVPMRIRRLQYIDFTKGYEQGFQKLLEVVSMPVTVEGDAAAESSSQVASNEPAVPVVESYEPAPAASVSGGWKKYLIGAGSAFIIIFALIIWLNSGPDEEGEDLTTPAANALNSPSGQPGGAQSAQTNETLGCIDYGEVASPQTSTEPTTISFFNNKTEPVLYFWITPEGKAEQKGELASGEETFVKTSTGHIWMVTDKQDRCIGLYQAPDDIDIH